MTIKEAWHILEIKETTDENEIQNAYRTKLLRVHPEDDPEGFKKLREAYEFAINEVRNPSTPVEVNLEEMDEYQRLAYDLTKIYDNYKDRITPSVWKEYLSQEIFVDLDTADKAREAILAAFLDRFYLPHDVWVEVNNVFMIDKDVELLKEMFPENFLYFIIRHTDNNDFIDYNRLITRDEHIEDFKNRNLTDIALNFEGVPDAGIESNFDTEEDAYLSELFELKYGVDQLIENSSSDEVRNRVLSQFKSIEQHEFWHPMEYIEKMRVFAFTENIDNAEALARNILFDDSMGNIDYAKAEAGRILLNNYETLTDEEIAFIRETTEEILSRLPEFFSARLSKSILLYIDKEYEKASEYIVDTINSSGDDNLSLTILSMINKELISKYEAIVSEDPDNSENRILLVRYLCQLERWDDAIEAFADVTIDDEWICDYHWFLGRSLFETEQYAECIPHLTKWNTLLEDITNEIGDTPYNELPVLTQHRLNRRNYGYAILGRAYTATKQFDLAEIAYDSLASFSDDPSHKVPALADKAMMYYDTNKCREALDVLDSILNEYGTVIPVLQLHQEIAFTLNEPQIVIDDFYKIINEVPNIIRPYVVAYRVFLNYNQIDDAERVLDLADKQGFDESVTALMRVQMSLLFLENSEQAFDALKELQRLRGIADEAYAANPDYLPIEPADVYYEIASLAYKMQDAGDDPEVDIPDMATKAYDTAPKHWDYLKDCQTLLTNIYGSSMQSDELIKMLGKGEDPDAETYYTCASYYANRSDYRQAIPLLIRTVELMPNHPEAHNTLQHMYTLRYNDYEDKTDIEEAGKEASLQLKCSDASYFFVERGLYYQDISNHERAINDFEAAVRRVPNNVYAHNGIGRSLTALKRFDEAEAALLKAIDCLDDDDKISIPYENIIKLYSGLGRYEDAIKYTQLMIDRCGNNVTDSSLLGRLHLKAEDYKTAYDIYLQCFDMLNEYKKKNPNSSWATYRTLKLYIDILDLSFIAKFEEKVIDDLLASFVTFLEDNDLRLHPKTKSKLTVLKKPRNNYEALEPEAHPSNWAFLADIYNDVGMFLLYTLRDYERALMYFMRQSRYMDYTASSSTIDELKYKGDVLRQIATCYAYLNDKSNAKKYASQALKWYLYYKSDTQYLSNIKIKPLRAVNLCMASFLAGDDDYKRYLDMITEDSYKCSHCNFKCCYEAYLVQARIYDILGEYEKAARYYDLAFLNSKDDCEAKLSLERCSNFV